MKFKESFYTYNSYIEQQNREILVGYKCSDSACEWNIGPLSYWKALQKFGRHNRQDHGMTIHVHLETIYAAKKNQAR